MLFDSKVFFHFLFFEKIISSDSIVYCWRWGGKLILGTTTKAWITIIATDTISIQLYLALLSISIIIVLALDTLGTIFDQLIFLEFSWLFEFVVLDVLVSHHDNIW